MDVSDGLLLDLATLLAASGGLGAELFADAIPVSAAATQRASAKGARRDLGLAPLVVVLAARAPVNGWGVMRPR